MLGARKDINACVSIFDVSIYALIFEDIQCK